jgi:SAM-dependent methyltransferase
MIYGIGRRLGIFNYLYEKSKSQLTEGKITSISFTLEELSEKLNLDLKYLDAWLHMALECGLFEIEECSERCAKTAPHVFDLFVDRNSMFYIGSITFGFYQPIFFMESLLENFKTGKLESFLELPGDFYKEGQHMSAATGKIVEGLFSKFCKEEKKRVRKGGTVLEVGCGYGLNLENWAKKYKKAKFVGIDIDPQGIEHAKKIVEKNEWNDRVQIIGVSLEEYARSISFKFDLIILNQVLHEMDPDENYRKSVLEVLYSLLKEDGILVVGESMIPNTFTRGNFQLFEVMHKWFEVGIGSRFYDENSFRELINSTSFKNPELIRERINYCWVIRK